MRRNRINNSLTSRRKVAKVLSFMAFLSLLVACSTTSAIPDGEHLYTGMEETKYSNYQPNQHFNDVKGELDVVLATKPNASWMGSPSVRSPSLLVCGYGMLSHRIRPPSVDGWFVRLALHLC